ncbi:MAG: hypothetical protein ACYDBQ_01265 [Thermoplasmatota archaeon]
MATSLQARIGPLGQLYDAPLRADIPVPERFDNVLDFVAGLAFPIYGLSTKAHIRTTQFPAFGQCARQAQLGVHCVSHGHPMDSPPFRDGPRRHASAEVQAKRFQNAAAAGLLSFTVHPPKAAACTLDQLEAEVGKILDSVRPGETPLRICNGPTGDHLLPTVEDLLDFCKQTRIQPTISVANEFLATGLARDVDSWLPVMHRVPEETLFLYANYRLRNGQTPKLTIFNDDSNAHPPVGPMLDAAEATKRRPSILVYGDRPEADALGVLRLQAALEGVDLATLQTDRKHTRRHRRIATVSDW